MCDYLHPISNICHLKHHTYISNPHKLMSVPRGLGSTNNRNNLYIVAIKKFAFPELAFRQQTYDVSHVRYWLVDVDIPADQPWL